MHISTWIGAWLRAIRVGRERTGLSRTGRQGEGKNIATASYKHGLFALNTISTPDVAMIASTKEATALWHKRYGHMSSSYLLELSKYDMVKGLPTLSSTLPTCSDCLAGKQHRVPFEISSTRAKKPLELVHTDLCDPLTPNSCGGKRYFPLFIDDYS